MGDCPVCNRRFHSQQELQAHVNSHFEGGNEDEVQLVEECHQTGALPAGQACPQCGATVPPSELVSHLLAHQLEQEDLQQLEAGTGPSGTSDAVERAAAEERDAAAAAALAAAEWGDESAAAAAGGSSHNDGNSSDSETAAAHQAQLEELYFQELRAKYGFTAAQRAGACRVCGEAGHWARECPRNPEVQAAAARVLDPPTPAAIVASQQRARPTALVGPGLVQLLAACLESQPLPWGGGPGSYAAALCGPVQHFGATLFSSGWGCGYNNMQMMAAHLLAARPEAREVLFGGAGWVPDIPALQAWLEAAWRAGYDLPGAEQLGGRVQGTHKWVGTTEAAALLRSFGLRAQIVDFGTQRGAQPSAAVAATTAGAAAAAASTAGPAAGAAAGAVPVHPNVECDGCGQCPIRGDRYSSQARPNYDLCRACHAKPEATAAGPFLRMLPGAVQFAGSGAGKGPDAAGAAAAGSSGSGGGGVAQLLLPWVWRYFTSEGSTALPSSSSGGTGSMMAAAAAAAAAAGADGIRLAASGAGGQATTAPSVGSSAGPGSAKRPRLDQGRVRLSGKSPLYFQHEGHSRTIIGIERRLVGQERRAEYTLLILDPGTPGPKLAAALQSRQGWQRLLKRRAHTLRHGQYQLLFVEPGLAEGPERDALKTVAACQRY